jgi:hypothetical protein
MSTNKVYGDAPNRLRLTEKETRWDYSDPEYASGIGETFPIDHSMHSIFGASKVATYVMVQEYGRYPNADLLPEGRLSDGSEPFRSRTARLSQLSHLVMRSCARRIQYESTYVAVWIDENRV